MKILTYKNTQNEKLFLLFPCTVLNIRESTCKKYTKKNNNNKYSRLLIINFFFLPPTSYKPIYKRLNKNIYYFIKCDSLPKPTKPPTHIHTLLPPQFNSIFLSLSWLQANKKLSWKFAFSINDKVIVILFCFTLGRYLLSHYILFFLFFLHTAHSFIQCFSTAKIVAL